MTKILVIDDEAMIRNVVSALLRQAGHDVVDAEHGLNGIAMAQTEKPDLILLDVMMPVVDGFEVLRRLGEDPVSSSIPVIMLTAKIDAATERTCMELGAVDYIKKPWGPQEIEERVAMALGYPELVKPETAKPEPAKPETANPGTNKPKLVKPDEAQFKQSTTETETGLGDCTASPLADLVVDAAEEEYEPEELSPTRFRTKEFRIQSGDVDNWYLA